MKWTWQAAEDWEIAAQQQFQELVDQPQFKNSHAVRQVYFAFFDSAADWATRKHALWADEQQGADVDWEAAYNIRRAEIEALSEAMDAALMEFNANEVAY